MMTDECTTKKLRVSYARVLIEVNITMKLKVHITIRDPRGNEFSQPLECEWKLRYCQERNQVGHDCALKQKKKYERQLKQQWIVKPNHVQLQVEPTREENKESNNEIEEKQQEWIKIITISKIK